MEKALRWASMAGMATLTESVGFSFVGFVVAKRVGSPYKNGVGGASFGIQRYDSWKQVGYSKVLEGVKKSPGSKRHRRRGSRRNRGNNFRGRG